MDRKAFAELEALLPPRWRLHRLDTGELALEFPYDARLVNEMRRMRGRWDRGRRWWVLPPSRIDDLRALLEREADPGIRPEKVEEILRNLRALALEGWEFTPDRKNHEILVRTPYDPEIVAIMRGLGGRWSRAAKVWRLPLKVMPKLLDELRRWFARRSQSDRRENREALLRQLAGAAARGMDWDETVAQLRTVALEPDEEARALFERMREIAQGLDEVHAELDRVSRDLHAAKDLLTGGITDPALLVRELPPDAPLPDTLLTRAEKAIPRIEERYRELRDALKDLRTDPALGLPQRSGMRVVVLDPLRERFAAAGDRIDRYRRWLQTLHRQSESFFRRVRRVRVSTDVPVEDVRVVRLRGVPWLILRREHDRDGWILHVRRLDEQTEDVAEKAGRLLDLGSEGLLEARGDDDPVTLLRQAAPPDWPVEPGPFGEFVYLGAPFDPKVTPLLRRLGGAWMPEKRVWAFHRDAVPELAERLRRGVPRPSSSMPPPPAGKRTAGREPARSMLVRLERELNHGNRKRARQMLAHLETHPDVAADSALQARLAQLRDRLDRPSSDPAHLRDVLTQAQAAMRRRDPKTARRFLVDALVILRRMTDLTPTQQRLWKNRIIAALQTLDAG